MVVCSGGVYCGDVELGHTKTDPSGKTDGGVPGVLVKERRVHRQHHGLYVLMVVKERLVHRQHRELYGLMFELEEVRSRVALPGFHPWG